MSAATAHAPALSAEDAARLSIAQWRSLARLCRWVERDEREAAQLFGPRVLGAVRALRQAQAVRRRRRHDRSAVFRAAPFARLAALADAAGRWAVRPGQRPQAFYAPATSTLGPGLLLRLHELKDWLHQHFPLEAAVPPDAAPADAARHAREVLMRQCLALCGSDDGFHRRRHLLQLLSEHGYHEPLLRLVRRATADWAPAGWAADWSVLGGIDDDERTLAEIDQASAAAARALGTWSTQPSKAPAAPAAAPFASAASADAVPTAARAACTDRTARTAATLPSMDEGPLILRVLQLPSRLRWTVAAAAVLAVGIGLVLHLRGGDGPAAARWVVFLEADGTTMSIDPDSIRRDGRLLTYRVGVVRSHENSSAVAVFTADCDRRERRLETVQHYRGTRFQTATLYEVRGTPTSPWAPGRGDVRLLQAACERS